MSRGGLLEELASVAESCACCLVLVTDVLAELKKLMNTGASVRVRDQSDGTLLRSIDSLPFSFFPFVCYQCLLRGNIVDIHSRMLKSVSNRQTIL